MIAIISSKIRRYFEGNPLMSRLARGAAWSTLSLALTQIILMLTWATVARIVGKEIFGEIGLVRVTLSSFSVLISAATGFAATKYIAELRYNDSHKLSAIIMLALMFTVFLGGGIACYFYVFAESVSQLALGSDSSSQLIRLSSGLILFGAVNGMLQGCLVGLESFKIVAKINVFGAAIGCVLLLFLSKWHDSEILVVGMIINMAAVSLMMVLAVTESFRKHGIRFRLKGVWREKGVLWRFSLPSAIASGFAGPTNWICVTMLINKGGGYGELGIFSVANQWYLLLFSIPSVINSAMVPVLSDQYNKVGPLGVRAIVIRSFKITAVVVLPLVIIGILTSNIIIKFYGDDYQGLTQILCVMFITVVPQIFIVPIGHSMAAMGKMWFNCGLNVIRSLVFIVVTFYLVDYGALGLGLSRLTAFTSHMIIGLIVYNIMIKDCNSVSRTSNIEKNA